MLNRQYAPFIGCESEYPEAAVVLFGAPFDSTTSYRPGTRFASREMRAQSFGLETYSPYLDRDLSDIAVFDAGDLELPFGDTQKALVQIEALASDVFDDGKIPVMLGGEHLVTLGAVRAAFRHHPDLCLIHFDAHADLRDDYLGVSLSHASVIRRCHDFLGDGRIFQFGIRSGDKSEFLFSGSHTHLQKFDFTGLSDVLAALGDKPLYLTVDLDVLDPSVFPGTGTPEAGGVTFRDLRQAIKTVCVGRVVGCDLVELSPVYDQSGVSTATACKTLRELLLSLHLLREE
ncbi:agmatinase [Oscillospiraceae bacterium CM]|nr:agmatinase [Oscillospiraceae bacterium CM]